MCYQYGLAGLNTPQSHFLRMVMSIRLSNGTEIPIEMHKVRIVQKTRLAPARERLKAMEEAGYNTFLLRSRDIFLDMLTDSGTNAMSDNQQAAMMQSDDAYAGSESFYRLLDSVREIFGYEYLLPVHQGRAAEHLLAKTFVKPGQIVPMNYHFTTTKAHFNLAGGKVLELYGPEALNTESTFPFKGNMDLDRLRAVFHGEPAPGQGTDRAVGHFSGGGRQPHFRKRLLHSPARARI